MCSVIRSVFVEAIEMIKPIIKMFILIFGLIFYRIFANLWFLSRGTTFIPSRQVATECGDTLTILEENKRELHTCV